MTIKVVTEETIAEAAALLTAGQCVVIPTETVYGLAGNALADTSVKRIYEIKKRNKINPLISHFNSICEIEKYVDLSPEGKKLAHAFWPGPMSLIVKRRDNCMISDLATAGLDTVAVRVPNHPTAQKIIAACGFPLAAPSANASGEISPTSAAHVMESLGTDVPLIIADKTTEIGLESTVIDVTGDRAVILRHGAITAEQVTELLGYDATEKPTPSQDKPKSPGQMFRHYAPSKPIRLRAVDVKTGEALLAFGSTKFMNTQNLPEDWILNLSESGDLYEAAHNLFAFMRQLDKTDADSIAVMDIPGQGIGTAINDRLNRAAEG